MVVFELVRGCLADATTHHRTDTSIEYTVVGRVHKSDASKKRTPLQLAISESSLPLTVNPAHNHGPTRSKLLTPSKWRTE